MYRTWIALTKASLPFRLAFCIFDHGMTGTWSRRLPSHLPSFITPGVSHIAGAGSREWLCSVHRLQHGRLRSRLFLAICHSSWSLLITYFLSLPVLACFLLLFLVYCYDKDHDPKQYLEKMMITVHHRERPRQEPGSRHRSRDHAGTLPTGLLSVAYLASLLTPPRTTCPGAFPLRKCSHRFPHRQSLN